MNESGAIGGDEADPPASVDTDDDDILVRISRWTPGEFTYAEEHATFGISSLAASCESQLGR